MLGEAIGLYQYLGEYNPNYHIAQFWLVKCQNEVKSFAKTHDLEQVEFFPKEVVDLTTKLFLDFVPLDLTDHLLVVHLLLVQRLVLVLPDVWRGLINRLQLAPNGLTIDSFCLTYPSTILVHLMFTFLFGAFYNEKCLLQGSKIDKL